MLLYVIMGDICYSVLLSACSYDDWHFCHFNLFVLIFPIIPCSVWWVWHADRRCLLPEHLISPSVDGSHFCMAWTFLQFSLCPLDFVILDYRISEFVLFWIILQPTYAIFWIFVLWPVVTSPKHPHPPTLLDISTRQGLFIRCVRVHTTTVSGAWFYSA